MQGVFIRGKFGSRTRINSLPIQQPDTFNIHAVILLPAHPASFVHKFLFQRVLASLGMQ